MNIRGIYLYTSLIDNENVLIIGLSDTNNSVKLANQNIKVVPILKL